MPPETTPLRRAPRAEILVAIGGFVLFAIVVLTKATAMLEPDDFAYRASIAALSHGQILLTNAQYRALSRELAASGGQGILQWHHMTSGRWISEKNPGYPFFAVLFYMIHALRLAPLFYGALAGVGLYAGARAWLGRWAGTYAVWLYFFSGAALVFAWRATMASFTDASLIAAGFGALLWVACRPEASPRRRLLVGLGAFLALEGAVFVRYTNVVELAVAVLAVLVLGRRVALSWRTIVVWLTSVVLFGAGVLAFDAWAYGSATSTGYSAGEITFSLSSFWPNLKGMPGRLTTSMPMWLLAAAALVWIGVRLARSRQRPDRRPAARRDALVAAVLAAGWLGMWILYLNYSWTASMVSGGPGGGGGGTVHVIRFYIPVLGLIALLGTWLVARAPKWAAWSVIGVLVVAALLSFHSMASGQSATGIPGGGGFGTGGPPGKVGRVGTHPGGPAGKRGAPPGGGSPPSGGYGPGGAPPAAP